MTQVNLQLSLNIYLEVLCFGKFLVYICKYVLVVPECNGVKVNVFTFY